MNDETEISKLSAEMQELQAEIRYVVSLMEHLTRSLKDHIKAR